MHPQASASWRNLKGPSMRKFSPTPTYLSIATVLLLASIAQAQWVPDQQDATQEKNFCTHLYGSACSELPNYSDAKIAADDKVAAIEAAIALFDPMDPRVQGWQSSLHDLVMLVVDAECDGSAASTAATSAFTKMHDGDAEYQAGNWYGAYYKYYSAVADYYTCCTYARRAANNLKGGTANWAAPAVAVQDSIHYQLDQLLAAILAEV